MALAPGTRFGPYEVVDAIGAGGMGEVYRATDTKLKREVAIKVLPESFAGDADRLARFQREAEVLASLNHSNIAQIYGLEEAEGATALIMEFVEGATLADRIAAGPIPPEEALNIAMQIADALEAAHGSQIVHRDLKPANINLRPDGTIKVLDFGIAKAIETQAISGRQTPALTTPAMTETGVIMGTAAYMAPEQARGLLVDERADIWAFGCLLYEMLTGQPAFGGEDIMLTLARVLDRDTDLSSIPGTISPAVRHTIKLCLEKDVKKRVADIRDVRLALAGAFESLPQTAQAPAVTQNPLRRSGVAAAAGLIIGAMAAGAAVFAVMRPEALPPSAAPPPLPVSRFFVTPPSTAPLAALGGYDMTISQDGTKLAYFAQNLEGGGVSLYVRDLDELEGRPVPGVELPVTTGGNMNPFFSPDGTSIGYRSPGEGIMRVAINGGAPMKIADDTGGFLGASWGTDDTLIYSEGDGLYRISARGGGTPELILAQADAGDATIIAPVRLPDDRGVLFSLAGADDERVAVLDLETGEVKTLVEGGVQNPTYTATGHVTFARGTTLMSVPFDPDELAVTGEPVTVQQGVRRPGLGTAADYAVSATGTLVYVPGTGESATSEVVWVDRNGRVTESALSEPLASPHSPRLSPDGESLVVAIGVGGSALWVHDLRGRPPIPLSGVGDNRFATWSPDGSEIAFVSSRTGSYDSYRAPADGSLLEPLPLSLDGALGAPAAWSAEHGFVMFRPAGPGGADIVGIRSEPGAAVIDVAATPDQEMDAALSPSGRWLAYVSDRTGRLEIWVKRYPDGISVRVSSNGGFEPRWSADESELYYLQGNSMMAVPVDTGQEFSFDAAVQIFTTPFFVSQSATTHSYDVARDGRFLMIQPLANSAEPGSSSSIVVVQNWFEELESLTPTE